MRINRRVRRSHEFERGYRRGLREGRMVSESLLKPFSSRDFNEFSCDIGSASFSTYRNGQVEIIYEPVVYRKSGIVVAVLRDLDSEYDSPMVFLGDDYDEWKSIDNISPREAIALGERIAEEVEKGLSIEDIAAEFPELEQI